MARDRNYFEQAADALQRALSAQADEQAVWIEEALRLNRVALAEERARLAKTGAPGVFDRRER